MNVLMVVALLYLVMLTYLVVSHGFNKVENASLLVTSIILGCWVASVYGLQTGIGASVVYSRAVFTLGLWSILSLLQFVGFIVLGQVKAITLLKTTLALGILFAILLMCGDSVITSIAVSQGGKLPTPQYGFMIMLYVYFMAICIIATAILIIRGATKGPQKARIQMRIIGYSIGISIIFAVTTSFLLPVVFNNTQIALLLPVALLLLMSGLSYAIVKYQLFDIRLAAVRTIGYFLTLSVMTVVYVFSVYTISVIFFGGTIASGVGMSPVNIVIALLLALIFQPVKRFFDQFTNNIFYRGQYDQAVFVREFGKILSYDTDLRLLLRQASKYIATNLKADTVFFAIPEIGTLGTFGSKRTRIPIADIDIINQYYQEHYEFPSVLVADAVKAESVRKILGIHRVRMVLPLMLQKHPIGYLFIGEHKSRGYTIRDVRVIESIANELTIAVQNSLSVEEIRELNEMLKNKVDTATQELRDSNLQLQRLDEAKNEFISMASHQLRTPLTSIKGYLDMVLQGDLGKVSSTQRAVLTEAFVSSERMVTLINDFLNVSRLQTGKFVIDRVDGDLKEILKDQLIMLRGIAKQHDLKFKTTIDESIPRMNIDTEKLRQVVLNFIDNAIYYSKPGSIVHVKLKKEKNQIVFTVKDTGIGVPKSEQSQLFGRFFRASNARQRRPDGTGVGLFLARKVILLHGGQIIFESEEGKGSVFGFRLPVRQPKTNS